MELHGLEIESLDEADLHRLVASGIYESRSLEFKLSLPSANDSEKQEFLADASSFANAAGGLILYGIREEDGGAVEVAGIKIGNPDAELLRLDGMLRSGLSPRIAGTRFATVPLADGSYVIALRIPRSWQAPHMVAARGDSRFYARGPAGKYPMDAYEIRNAFLASEGISTRLREFHSKRSSEIRGGRALIASAIPGLLVVHVVPLSAVQAPAQIDLAFLEKDPSLLLPMDGAVTSARYNLDGYATAYNDATGAVVSYSQLSRSGIIEAAAVNLVLRNRTPNSIPSIVLEREIAFLLSNGLTIYQLCTIDPPYVGFM